MREIRWHARAGQGAKTASQLYATAALRAGKSVQAFPEYGPERRGAPLRAYTRVDDKPIRRHDSVTKPDVVVVLEPSLLHEVDGRRQCSGMAMCWDRQSSAVGLRFVPDAPHTGAARG